MDLAARVAEGIEAHRNGNTAAALEAYQDVLSEDPRHPDGLHFLGLLIFNKDRPDDAIALIRQSLAIEGGNASAHNNLGNIYKLLDRPSEALEEYVEALDIDSDQPNVWRNLGIVAASLKDAAGVPVRLESLTRRYPGHGDAWRIYGLALVRCGRPEEGADALEESLRLGLDPLDICLRVVRYLHALGREASAVAHLEELSRIHPGSPAVEFQLASVTGEALPRAPEDYVRSHFDRFADTFDEVLDGLDYKAPDYVAEDVLAVAAETGRVFEDVVDLGCGTGLCGPLVRRVCGKLTGIDLSREMLQKAAGKGVYDFLVEGELVAFLNADLPTQFDLAICADTLIYLGDLTGFFAGLAKALKPGGVLVASVEHLESESESYRLHSSSRFAHSPDYLRRTAQAAGLVYGPERRKVLRMELGNEVPGTIFQVRKPVETAQDLP